MEQHYKIAGLRVAMDSFGRTDDFSRPYMIDREGQPDIVIQVDWSKWERMYPGCAEQMYEYMATGESFYTQLLNFDGMMIHSSSVIMDGRAYLFSAPCGTGKSTHVCLWRRVFGDERVRVLNDDKPALRLEDGVWYAYGTPWSGKTGQNLNLRAPLAGICIIERGETNEITPFTGPQMVKMILSQTTELNNPMLRLKQLDLLDKLLTQVPVWKLKCNMDPEAARISHAAMSAQ